MTVPLLEVDGVSVTFGGLAALQDVSIEVHDREIVSLIGPNGAGKTTLFNVVSGFVRPVSGVVRIRGRPLGRGHRPDRLARLGVARTLQGVHLWRGLTVVENVMAGAQCTLRAGLLSAALGLPRSSREERALRVRAMATLDRLGIADVASQYPEALPYGIQKRVAIARALVLEPALLMLDEPASGLSDGEMQELAELLRRLRSSMGVLLVEHHMEFVMSISDRVVVLNFGSVIAGGSPAEVQADPQVAEAYLGDQVAPGVRGPG